MQRLQVQSGGCGGGKLAAAGSVSSRWGCWRTAGGGPWPNSLGSLLCSAGDGPFLTVGAVVEGVRCGCRAMTFLGISD